MERCFHGPFKNNNSTMHELYPILSWVLSMSIKSQMSKRSPKSNGQSLPSNKGACMHTNLNCIRCGPTVKLKKVIHEADVLHVGSSHKSLVLGAIYNHTRVILTIKIVNITING